MFVDPCDTWFHLASCLEEFHLASCLEEVGVWSWNATGDGFAFGWLAISGGWLCWMRWLAVAVGVLVLLCLGGRVRGSRCCGRFSSSL